MHGTTISVDTERNRQVLSAVSFALELVIIHFKKSSSYILCHQDSRELVCPCTVTRRLFCLQANAVVFVFIFKFLLLLLCFLFVCFMKLMLLASVKR